MNEVKTYTPSEVTDAVRTNSGLLLVHFGSPLASACELIHRQLETLAPVFEGAVAFAEVELPLQDLDLIQAFGLEEVPTLILFHGSEDVERLEQVGTHESLGEFLEMARSYYGNEIIASDESAEADDGPTAVDE